MTNIHSATGSGSAEERPSSGIRAGGAALALARQNRAFRELGRIVAGYDGVLTAALPAVLSAVGAPWGVAYRVEYGALALVAAAGLPVSLRASVEALDLARYPTFAGARAVRSRRAVTCDRIFAPTVDAAVADDFDAASVARGVAVPIVHRNSVLGVLVLGLAPGEAADTDTLAFLDTAACLLAPPLIVNELLPEPDDERLSSPHAAPRCSLPGLPAVDLAAIAQRATRELASTFEAAGCEMRLVLRAGCFARVEEEPLVQAAVHLIANALEAAQPRERVPEKPSSPSIVRVSIERTGSSVILSVEDSGPGVPLDLRARIFDQGYTTKSRGRGKGLHFTRQTALLHGGHVEVESSVLGGAHFRMVLPASAATTCGPRQWEAPTLARIPAVIPDADQDAMARRAGTLRGPRGTP